MARKHTDVEVLEILNGIRDLLYKRCSYDQIRKEYGNNGQPMSYQTLMWYLRRIRAEDKTILERYALEKVPTEVQHLVKMLDDAILWCEKNQDDKNEALRDRLEVVTRKTQFQAAKIKILMEGPSIVNQIMKLTALIPLEDKSTKF